MKTIIHPRFSETDALGHISGSTLPVWFQEAREPILALFIQGDIRRHAAVIRRQEIDYLQEVFYGSDVAIHSCIAHIGRSSVRIQQTLWQDGQCKAENTATLIYFDTQSRTSTPVPDDIREQLAALRCEDGMPPPGNLHPHPPNITGKK